MSGMRNVNTFLFARYIVFALFTICNAVTCSVAVWNYSLVHLNQYQLAQIAVYLIFLGAFSLATIITLIFVELLCVDAVTTRVWFECGWVALFWSMELAGGAALLAIESGIACSGEGATIFLDALCTSERVLLAFTWMCTAILLVYLLALVFIAASHFHGNLRVWTSDVRSLRTVDMRQSLNSPHSPLTTRLKKHFSVDIFTPRPVRLKPPPLQYPSGLNAEYEVEPFHPVFVGPEQMDTTHPTDLPEAISLPPAAAAYIPPMKPVPPLPENRRNVVSLSLDHIEAPRGLKSSIVYANQPTSSPSATAPNQRASLPSPGSPPPPLGDWPRPDIMQQPVKSRTSRRRSPPPSAFECPKRHMTMVSSTSAELPSLDAGTTPRPRRPSGPRQRVPSVESVRRPAPLDLTGISNYGPGGRDHEV